ncbi:MAG: OmpA family protein, partial [Bacteroidia bacterium]|nr:OmpA family protein [Bacteroidia bacterium]
MQFIKTLLFITLTILSFCAKAQEYDGELQFIGKNYLYSKPLNNTKIKVMKGTTIVSEFNTKDNNSFKAKLDYGNVYDIYFYNDKCQPMYIRIFADGIPEEKRHYRITYALDIPFFPKDPNTIDTAQFTKQFHQIVFDGKSKFVDDTVYMNKFISNIYKKEPVVKKDTTVPFITTEKIKEYIQLAGKLSLDNDKQTPIKNKTVSLLNKKGEIISSSQTTNHGMFIFQGVDAEQADGITLSLNSTDNPNNDKIKLLNTSSQKIDIAISDPNQTYAFKNKEENQLISKLTNNDFKYNIAGKLVATNGTERKVGSNKTVYLMNNKNQIIQKTKTNALGNFLFYKIIPGDSYYLAYDSADSELNYIMNLYSVKDKFIKRLDSVSGKKFIYKFLSVSNTTFNDIVVDDSELKMNVKGRLYGDNKNNPLVNLKVMLLNDEFEKIDSAMTNEKGDFSFKHMPYTKQLLITAENEKNILESFNNILVFDNEDNLIKLVSTVKGHRFNYKPLSAEQSKLSEIYVDDPWLSIIEKDEQDTKPGNNSTIVENILFEFNKANLQEQSKQTLDKVVLAMLSNEKFSIELSAHSDSKGSDTYNLKLSEQRANSAKNYIISKGVNATRIKAIGYGESKLINNCGNNVICSDDEHAVNRRLEFKLI